MSRVAQQAVIPAKAGIQMVNSSHVVGNNMVVCFAECFFDWIPAFAGMMNPYISISNPAVIRHMITAPNAPNDWTCGESVLYSSHE